MTTKGEHVWVIECLQKSGKWKPVYSMKYREFARNEARWRTSHFGLEHRVRKYTATERGE